MKRSPLQRTAPLRRKTGVRRFNRARLAKRRAVTFGAQAQWCRTALCCVCNRTPADPHHEPPRSVGGRDRDTVPLCRQCHDERHCVGLNEFQQRHGIDLRGLAAEIHVALEERDGKCSSSNT